MISDIQIIARKTISAFQILPAYFDVLYFVKNAIKINSKSVYTVVFESAEKIIIFNTSEYLYSAVSYIEIL